MITMKVECLESAVRIKFFQFVLILDIIEQELYLNGNQINKNKSVRLYNPTYLKENTQKYPKKTIVQLASNKEVLVVDHSESSKFYFRYWDSIKDFHAWRHQATNTYMFKVDHNTGNKVLYQNDFEIPIHTWEAQIEPQIKVTNYGPNID